MACSCSCSFVRWRVETIRFTQSKTRYMQYQLQGGVWVEVEIAPPAGPAPELEIPVVLANIKELLTRTYRLADSDGHCKPDGEFACRCVRTGPYEPVLKWSVAESHPWHIPPLGGMQFWICQLDFEAVITKYRAKGECVAASLPGHQVEVPPAFDR